MTVVRVKKQPTNYPVALRDIPNQNNTTLAIMIKSYVIRRILEIILHGQLTPAITFDDMFKHCNILNITRKKQFDARKIIFSVLENLKSKTSFKILI